MTVDILPHESRAGAYGEALETSDRPSAITTLLNRFVQSGRLTIINPWGSIHSLGRRPGPEVVVRIPNISTLIRVLTKPALFVGEAYTNGALTIEKGSLREFLSICTSGVEASGAYSSAEIRRHLGKLSRILQQFNPIKRSRANVAHHYDLSGTLYDYFLDPDRQYSCAYFAEGNECLEEAQEKKKKLIERKLLLKPGMEVLDIGCGWGGLALHLAQHADVNVTGITLSKEQLKVAQERSKNEGLSDRARFLFRDYREEQGCYDRIVSVGMFEHVGFSHYGRFFNKWRSLLKPDGVGLLHAIGRMEPPGGTNPWLQKYIFPGGYCPALSEVLAAIERAGLWVTDIEILRLHYAETLRHWWDRFQANRDAIKALYDERFCRMWEFYLAGCEAAFRNGTMMVFQIQLAGRADTVPLSRDYLTMGKNLSAAGPFACGASGNQSEVEPTI